jgi:hypothetical protein
MPGAQTEMKFESNNLKQMLVLVRYKPAGIAEADSMLGGVAGSVQGAVNKVEDMASAIPGLSLFFKEEKEPEKKCDKEFNYFKEDKDWDSYIKKMKDDFPNRLNSENQVVSFEYDATDAKGREQEGKKLAAKIKSAISGWKDYGAAFHFIGVGQGGNVANECIGELIRESDFKKKWKIGSVVYVGTPLYRNQHVIDLKAAGNPTIHSYGNHFDLTQQVIEYFEPSGKLLTMIAESNSNPLSVFTGKLKAQLVATLGRLLSIKGFGTGYDNKGNVDKLAQCRDDVESLVSECVKAVKTIIEAVPGIVKMNELPQFGKMVQDYDKIPGECADRLKKLEHMFDDIAQGSGLNRDLNTSRIGINKILNIFCPLFDHVSASLKILSFDHTDALSLMDQVLDKAGIKKVLAPAEQKSAFLPVDPYIEKVAEMAKDAEKKKETDQKPGNDAEKSGEEVLYDQSVSMILKARGSIEAATDKQDLDISKASKEQKLKISEAITSMILPMVPGKGKFYAQILNYIPTGGLNDFLSKVTADSAMAPLAKLIGSIGYDFDEELKTSIANLDNELTRIKGFFRKSNFPVHKDANSLYFIYNSHNLFLKKPWGDILNTVDQETGFLDAMKSQGFENVVNLEQNEYRGNGMQKDNIQPARAAKKAEPAAV